MRRCGRRGYGTCVGLGLVALLVHHHDSSALLGAHHGATTGQVERALGWSLVSGLATGVGGSVVFCLEPPSRHGAAVSAKILAFLLGLAVGVMIVLSILDMILPKLWKWGVVRCSTAQPSPAQHSPAQHSTAQHSPAQPSPAQPSPAQPSPAQHSTAQHSTH
jgi:zinc transporter ZupT